MRLLRRHGSILLAITIALAGCDNGSGDRDAGDGGPDSGDAAPDAPVVERPPEICLDPEGLGGGPHFTDVTEELGLGPSGLDIQGGGVVSVDIDGDRWPDLVTLRRVNGGVRDDEDDPVWNTRVLRNTGGDGFEDVTMASGLVDTRGGGWGRPITLLIFADVDNDGDVDAYSGTRIDYDTAAVGDSTEIMLNNGDGTFDFGPTGDFCDDPEYDPIYGASFVDYDLDGVVDLFTGHQYGRYGVITSSVQDSLFAGLGDGAFTDVTEAAGLRTAIPGDPALMAAGQTHKPTWGTTACDVDSDGWPDLLVANYGQQYDVMWHAGGDGTYSEIGDEVGLWSDDNEDYSDNLKYQCHCHSYGGDCDPMPPRPPYLCWDSDLWSALDAEPWRLGGNTSSLLCGDLDGDGDMDIVTIVLDHEWAGQSTDHTEILYNEGVGSGGAFVRPGRAATGLEREHIFGWNEGDLGGALVDFDNDGRLDIWILSSAYPGTHSLLYRQLRSGTFREMSDEAGTRVVHGIGGALIDYDRDGDYDLVTGLGRNQWDERDDGPMPDADYMTVHRNDVGQDSNRVMLHLEGAGAGGANRSAVGARVEVRAGDRLIVREVMAGEGHDAYQHDPLMIIGVGDQCRVDDVTIRWPNAEHTETVISDVPSNYVLVVHETDGYEFQTLEEYVGG